MKKSVFLFWLVFLSMGQGLFAKPSQNAVEISTAAGQWEMSDGTAVFIDNHDRVITRLSPKREITTVVVTDEGVPVQTKRRKTIDVFVSKNGASAGQLYNDLIDGQEAPFEDSSTFSFFDSRNRMVWHAHDISNRPSLISFSDNGSLVALTKGGRENQDHAWIIVKNSSGKTLFKYGPVTYMQRLSLSGDGRFGVAQCVRGWNNLFGGLLYFSMKTKKTFYYKFREDLRKGASGEIKDDGTAVVSWIEQDRSGNIPDVKHEKVVYRFQK